MTFRRHLFFFFKGVVQNFGASVLPFNHWRTFQHVWSSPSNSAEPPGATPVQVNSFCELLRTPTSTHHSKKWINIRQLVQESRTADCCAFAEAGEDSTSRCRKTQKVGCVSGGISASGGPQPSPSSGTLEEVRLAFSRHSKTPCCNVTELVAQGHTVFA